MADLQAVAPIAGSILVVDDDSLCRDLLAHHLQNAGHTITRAEDGSAALEFILKNSYDLILLDISMPGMDGLKVLSMIRKVKSASDLPVMMATAMDDSSLVVWAMKLGANDYVTKPFDLPVVLARVRAQLRVKKVVDEMKEREGQFERRIKELEAANSVVTAENERLKGRERSVA